MRTIVAAIHRVFVTAKRPAMANIGRRYIGTGDERRPLAGILLPIESIETATDDPESAWLVGRGSPPPRGIHLPITLGPYSFS